MQYWVMHNVGSQKSDMSVILILVQKMMLYNTRLVGPPQDIVWVRVGSGGGSPPKSGSTILVL